MENPHFALVFDLTEIKQFQSIFGDTTTQVAWDDINRDLTAIKNTLLKRYDIIKQTTCDQIGRCYIVFKCPQNNAFIDIEEQLQVIVSTGRTLIRKALVDQLGLATGRKLDFSLAAVDVNLDASQAELYARLNMALEKDQSERADDTQNDVSPFTDITRAEFEKLILDKDVQTYFQSIVTLPDADIVGFEALTRGPEGSNVFRADLLFGSASHFGLTLQLELLCIEKALEWMDKIPSHQWVSFNIGPELLSSNLFKNLISQERYKSYLNRIVFELTEHLPLESAQRIRALIDEFKQLGVRFSLDDTGCGFFDLETVEQLRPAMVKLCITVIKRIENHNKIGQEIAETRATVDSLGGQTLGEGVETEIQRQVLTDCGVQLAQGYLFDKPAPAKVRFT